MMLVEVFLLKLALIWRYAFDVVTMHTYKMGFCISSCCELWCDHLYISMILLTSHISVCEFDCKRPLSKNMKRGFLSTKRVTKHVTGSDENPCFSFVLFFFFLVWTIWYPATTLGPDYSGFGPGAKKVLPTRVTPRGLELGSKPSRAT